MSEVTARFESETKSLLLMIMTEVICNEKILSQDEISKNAEVVCIPIGSNGHSSMKSNTDSGFTRTAIPVLFEQLASIRRIIT
jgi:hypothetical protein